jgi:hypothetical protein
MAMIPSTVSPLDCQPQLLARSLSIALGLRRPRSEAFFETEGISLDTAILLRAFGTLECRYASHLAPRHPYIVAPNGQRVRLFECEFKVAPVAFNLKQWRAKLPAQAFTFGMFLSQSEINEHVPNFYELDFDHVADAFAYLRFYRIPEGFFVVEIQNDVYGQLREKTAKARFGHWHRLLMLAFHAYARTLTMGTCASIMLAGENYILRRFPSINPSLASRVYHELPKFLDYVPLRGASFAAEPVTSPMRISSAWKKELDNARSYFELLFLSHLSEVQEDRLYAAMSTLACFAANSREYLAQLEIARVNHSPETRLSIALQHACALRDMIEIAASLLRNFAGSILIMNFADGRAFDHVRHHFNAHRVLVASRSWRGPDASLPPVEDRVEYKFSAIAERASDPLLFVLHNMDSWDECSETRFSLDNGTGSMPVTLQDGALVLVPYKLSQRSDLVHVCKRMHWNLYRYTGVAND